MYFPILKLSIFNLRVVGGAFFIFIQILKETSANSAEPDQMPHFAASDLGFALLADVPQKGTLCILVDFSIQIKAIRMGFP